MTQFVLEKTKWRRNLIQFPMDNLVAHQLVALLINLVTFENYPSLILFIDVHAYQLRNKRVL